MSLKRRRIAHHPPTRRSHIRIFHTKRLCLHASFMINLQDTIMALPIFALLRGLGTAILAVSKCTDVGHRASLMRVSLEWSVEHAVVDIHGLNTSQIELIDVNTHIEDQSHNIHTVSYPPAIHPPSINQKVFSLFIVCLTWLQMMGKCMMGDLLLLHNNHHGSVHPC